MSYWIQHGYGKGTKLTDIRTEVRVAGVILSPGDEDRDAICATVEALSGCEALLDPQTYVYSLPGGTARFHRAHGLEFQPLSWSTPPGQILAIAQAVVDANKAVGTARVIAPTCLQRSFADVWASLALQLTRATLDAADVPVLASLVVDEPALSSWREIQDWLDVATGLDVDGFYVVVNRGRAPYLAPWDTTRLTNFLRLIYSLAELNNYEVIVGYADFEGLLAQSVGATGHATGWHYSLRRFSETKWQPSTGGRAAAPRYTSRPLLTPLRAVGEADQVASSKLSSRLITSSSARARLTDDPEHWSASDAWAQYLMAVGKLSDRMAAGADVPERVALMSEWSRRALGYLAELQEEGVVLPAPYETRLRAFGEAMNNVVKYEEL